MAPTVAARPRGRPGPRHLGGDECWPSLERRSRSSRRSRRCWLPVAPSPSVAADALRGARWLPGTQATHTPRRPGRRLLRARRARADAARGHGRARLGVDARHAVARRARHDGRLRADPPRPERRHRGGRHGARAMPSRRGVPAAGGRLVPLLRPPPPHPAAPGGQGAERGFEDEKLSYVVLCRSPRPHAGAARVLRRPDPPRRPRRCSTSARRTAWSGEPSPSATARATSRRASSAGATRSSL